MFALAVLSQHSISVIRGALLRKEMHFTTFLTTANGTVFSVLEFSTSALSAFPAGSH